MITSCFQFNLTPCGGADISKTCEEAQHIADTLRIDVRFVFNDVTCTAQPGGDALLLLSEYRTISNARYERRKRWPEIANSLPVEGEPPAGYGAIDG